MSVIPLRKSLSFFLLLISFVLLALPAMASIGGFDAALPAPKGVDIGSTGFDEMLDKQLGSRALKTEALPDGGFKLTNTVQTLSARIASRGVIFDSIGNSSGKGGFSLSLVQWGREANLQDAESSKIYSDKDVVYHTYIATLQEGGIAEKFSNTPNGIRQDFIVPVKPQGEGALHVKLHVSHGSVKEKNISSKKDGAVILLNSGRQLTYDRLAVMDSTGKNIPAKIVVTNNNVIDLVIEDAAAIYPLTIDPTVSDANWISMGSLPGANGKIYAILAVGSDVYVAGTFSVIGDVLANRIAKWDGVKWNALGEGISVVYNGGGECAVRALAMDSAGKLYAAGTFLSAGGVAVNNIAKWDGASWSALGTGLANQYGPVIIYALSVNVNDEVYAGGSFTTAGGFSSNALAKWNGSSWSAINGFTISDDVLAMALDGNGDLYVGGDFLATNVNGTGHIAKWDGNTWSALASGLNNVVNSLAIDSNGNLFVGGVFSFAGAVAVNHIAKWDGNSWSAVGAGVSDQVTSLAIDGLNNLYVGCRSVIDTYDVVGHIRKWDGVSWETIGSGARGLYNAAIYALAFDGDGALYVGGDFSIIDGVVANNFIKRDSEEWSVFGSGANARIRTLVLDNVGNLYVGGDFGSIAGVANTTAVAMWDGNNWYALGSGVGGCTENVTPCTTSVNTLIFDQSDNLYVGGNFVTAGGIEVNHVAKWDGLNWVALGGGTTGGVTGEVFSFAIGSNSSDIYVGGDFSLAGNVAANHIAKWNGSAWSALGSGILGVAYQEDMIPYALAIDSNNNLYAGGQFSKAGGLKANNVAKWNGSSWSAVGAGNGGGVNATVRALVIDSNNILYAGGDFSLAYNNTNIDVNNVAKWDGNNWTALGDGMNESMYPSSVIHSSVYALRLDNQNNLYAGGWFTTANDVTVNNIAKWDGSAWSGFESGVALGPKVLAIAIDIYNDFYVGGEFVQIGDEEISAYMAKWVADLDADSDSLLYLDDNCPHISNVDQLDFDNDKRGDACDSDDDNDSVLDIDDALPLDSTESVDTDSDGTGNIADADDDNDSILDVNDVFPLNALESVDADGDLIGDNGDNCPSISNASQIDTDSDADGDDCDSDDDDDGTLDIDDTFPLDATETVDADSDGVGDNSDNCLSTSNADQADADSNGFGDVCDNYSQSGTKNGDNLGMAVVLGDMNDDGYDDMVIGAPLKDISSKTNVGQIKIISGADGTTLKAFNGTEAGGRFGSAIAIAEDQNDDGIPDLVVGFPLADPTLTLIDAGKVNLYSGANGKLIKTLVKGAKAGDQLGAAVTVGDIDNDGEPNLIVGVPRKNISGQSDVGQVIAYAGINKTVLYTRNGTQRGEGFGAAIAIDEEQSYLLVGSPSYDVTVSGNQGRVNIFDGTDTTALSAALYTLDGTTVQNNFGSSVTSFAEDLDGDMDIDWAVGSSKADVSAMVDAGKVEIFSGFNTTPIATIDGATAGDNFGASVGTGDINGDGVSDIAIGSPKFDTPANDAGRVEVMSGVLF